MTRTLSGAIVDHAERLFRYHDISQPAAVSDLIIGLGSYQPAVADLCARLHRDGVAPRILFTGGLGNWTRGVFDRPEAEVFRDRAIAAGVPAAAILTEPEARNLGDNVTLSRRMLTISAVDVCTIAVVTKRNTTRRARLTFAKHWPELRITLHGPDLPWQEQAAPPRNATDIVDEMVGDLQRILVYPTLGHQVSDAVPPEVMEAYRALVAAGFDRHLLDGYPVVPSPNATPNNR